jgi:cobyrinic acid a,c-diamide synthase
MAAAAGEDADVLVIEGVMGLFDGSAQPDVDGSTAEVARLLESPVVVVVDVWTMSTSVAALVHGLRDFDRRVKVAGVILNRVASDGHEVLCREALEPLGIPILGAMRHDDRLTWRERHLGLVPVAEHRRDVERAIGQLAAVVETSCDLDAVVSLARGAPTSMVAGLPAPKHSSRIRLALAGGPAFSFVYPENVRMLEMAGAEIVPFDPLVDRALPEHCHALYAGGGFPEVFGERLADNEMLLLSVTQAVQAGLVVWAECGGLLWLCRSLDGVAMAGVVPAAAKMTESLTIGYRLATTRMPSPLGPEGSTLRGYEFHRTIVDPPGSALELTGRFGASVAGFAGPALFASYLHQHLAGTPEVAERFVASAGRAAAATLS